jgi:hypothetical protein
MIHSIQHTIDDGDLSAYTPVFSGGLLFFLFHHTYNRMARMILFHEPTMELRCSRNRKAGPTYAGPASPGERREEIKSILVYAAFMPKQRYQKISRILR